ncbi:hypothetical protein PybrP1_009535 [[Pythium] brassicae (nom. inval.)]|nr:hypothetical protein PybrP1_009535 [[Pythium] brassicae (nom. inval.)]
MADYDATPLAAQVFARYTHVSLQGWRLALALSCGAARAVTLLAMLLVSAFFLVFVARELAALCVQLLRRCVRAGAMVLGAAAHSPVGESVRVLTKVLSSGELSSLRRGWPRHALICLLNLTIALESFVAAMVMDDSKQGDNRTLGGSEGVVESLRLTGALLALWIGLQYAAFGASVAFAGAVWVARRSGCALLAGDSSSGALFAVLAAHPLLGCALSRSTGRQARDDAERQEALDIVRGHEKFLYDSVAAREVLAESYVALESLAGSSDTSRQGEQSVEVVLRAVHAAVAALPADLRARVRVVGICGQMHGIVWWRSASDQRCSPEFLKQCEERVASATTSSSPLATGYGLATYAHTVATSPEQLLGFDACGTIQDLVAFVLCGHTSAKEATIDTTNAFSWGGFDLQQATWNRPAVEALGVPFKMLPKVQPPGNVIGLIAADLPFGLPAGVPVFIPIGDHPSSVVAAVVQHQGFGTERVSSLDATISLVNIGTSAQLATLLSAEEVAAIAHPSKSFEVRPFVVSSQFIGVAAALSGGNIFAWFVRQCRDWMRELQPGGAEDSGGDSDDARWYKQLIALGMTKFDTALVFRPTLNGERADPSADGNIERLRMGNWSLGDMSSALCKGLVENLFNMVPEELRGVVAAREMIGTGSALTRNELLRRHLAAKLAESSTQLHLRSAADAAIGAALYPDRFDANEALLPKVSGTAKQQPASTKSDADALPAKSAGAGSYKSPEPTLSLTHAATTHSRATVVTTTITTEKYAAVVESVDLLGLDKAATPPPSTLSATAAAFQPHGTASAANTVKPTPPAAATPAKPELSPPKPAAEPALPGSPQPVGEAARPVEVTVAQVAVPEPLVTKRGMSSPKPLERKKSGGIEPLAPASMTSTDDANNEDNDADKEASASAASGGSGSKKAKKKKKQKGKK